MGRSEEVGATQQSGEIGGAVGAADSPSPAGPFGLRGSRFGWALGPGLRRGAEAVGRIPAPLWVALVVVSAFGPYLFWGIRTEQTLVYGLALAFLWPIARSLSRRPVGLGVVLLLWLVPTLVAGVGALFPRTPPAPYTLGGSALAGIDDYVLPVALILLVGFWLSQGGSSGLLRAMAVSTVALATANAVVAILQFAGVLSGGAGLSAFWGEGPVVVATLALTMGRFTGVFNQPAEAGVAYSVALLLLTYLWMTRHRPQPVLYVVPLVVLITGAYLTASKTVMILGIPWLLFLLLIRSVRSREARHWLFLMVPAVVLVGVVLVVPLGSRWYGSQQVRWWLQSVASIVTSHASVEVPDTGAGVGVPGTGTTAGEAPVTSTTTAPPPLHAGGGLTETLSARRYGEDGVVREFARAMLDSEPWFGFGAYGLNIPADSAWLELLAVSGVVGLSAYILMMGYLGFEWVRRRRAMPPGLWTVSAGSLGLLVAGSTGFPPLTLNRSGTLLWLALLLSLFAAHRGRPSSGAEPEAAADG